MSEEQTVNMDKDPAVDGRINIQLEMTEESTTTDAMPEAASNKNGDSLDSDIAVIPDRVYFRIGDVAEITGIKPYVLRFWEKEFDLLKPVKNNSGQRIFRKKDVESVLLIKRLLYRERYSIEGAKKRIKELRKTKSLATEKRKRGELDESKLAALANIRRGLNELIDLSVRNN